MEDFDFVKDIPNRREIAIGNNKLILERKDPYGFIDVHFERGQIPKILEGSFTSFDEAYLAIKKYFQEKGKEAPALT